ncbi:MAG: hypothetical protein ACM3PW_10410 [Chlamydiota bacterium]
MEDEAKNDQLPRSSARALLRFVGSISADDLRLMQDAIEEDCEQIVADPEVEDS